MPRRDEEGTFIITSSEAKLQTEKGIFIVFSPADSNIDKEPKPKPKLKPKLKPKPRPKKETGSSRPKRPKERGDRDR